MIGDYTTHAICLLGLDITNLSEPHEVNNNVIIAFRVILVVAFMLRWRNDRVVKVCYW